MADDAPPSNRAVISRIDRIAVLLNLLNLLGLLGLLRLPERFTLALRDRNGGYHVADDGVLERSTGGSGDIQIGYGRRHNGSGNYLHAVQGHGQLSLHEGHGVVVGDGHAASDQRWNAGVDVEPGIFKQRRFAASYAEVGHRGIAGIVVGIESEDEARNSFRAQAHAGRAQTGGCRSQGGITQDYGEAVGWNSAGIAERDGKAELDVAGGNEVRPDDFAVLVEGRGCQLDAASGACHGIAEGGPSRVAEVWNAG